MVKVSSTSKIVHTLVII